MKDLSGIWERLTACSAARLIEPPHRFTSAQIMGGAIHLFSGEQVAGRVYNHGAGNIVISGFGSDLPAKIRFKGDGNIVFIGAHAKVAKSSIEMVCSGGLVYIGAFSELRQSGINLHGEGGRVIIGDHCHIGDRAIMSNTDGHAIYDHASGLRINPDRDIDIGDNVWIGDGARINKGAQIGRGAIIEHTSIVSGNIPPGSLAGGVPAAVRREGVTWSTVSATSLDEVETSPAAVHIISLKEALRSACAASLEAVT